MTKGILGRKIGMTQVFAENGELIPVTVIAANPNVVLQKKTTETDGYNAIQLGFEDKREKLTNKPEQTTLLKHLQLLSASFAKSAMQTWTD